MSDRSLSLIPTEVATASVMSDEALGIDDGGGIGTVVGASQGNSAVPDLNDLISAAPSLESLEGIFNAAKNHRSCLYLP